MWRDGDGLDGRLLARVYMHVKSKGLGDVGDILKDVTAMRMRTGLNVGADD